MAYRKTKKAFFSFVGLVAFCLVTVAVQSIASPTIFSDEKLAVWFFDVGQGDSALIQSGSTQILIDGGPSQQVIEKLSAVMPFWDRNIEYMISSHDHADHLVGLNAVADRYSFGEVWRPNATYSTELGKEFMGKTNDEIASAPDCLELGENRSLCILWPLLDFVENVDDENDSSLVLLLKDGDVEVLFTGDAGIEEEAQMTSGLVDVDVLKVGHHGSLSSSSSTFLEMVKPEYAVISVGENDYGHPSPTIVDRLQSVGAEILRTDQLGDIRLLSDGKKIEVASFEF
ncbi:MAG: MBL fold metallo-hydrolase [Patescibacteria group bacterium]